MISFGAYSSTAGNSSPLIPNKTCTPSDDSTPMRKPCGKRDRTLCFFLVSRLELSFGGGCVGWLEASDRRLRGARHFPSLWFLLSATGGGSIKFHLIRDFMQIAASRHPTIGTRKSREKRKPAHLDGESKIQNACFRSHNSAFERASTPLFCPRCPRYQACHRCGGWKDGLSTLPVNGRSFVNTIDAIIEDATGWQRSVHGIQYLLFASSLSFHQVLAPVRL